MSIAPLDSGYQWQEDPSGNLVAHPGRNIRRDMRATADPTLLVVVKRPSATKPTEIYCMGMERVAYRLAAGLRIRVPTTHLETVDGHLSVVQSRIEPARSWRQLGAAPTMRDNIVDREEWPFMAMFDVWMGNTDRRDENFLFEPIPPGASPGLAKGSRTWLIDQGQCGLWPADKFTGRAPDDIPADAGAVTGELRKEGEAAVGARMPPEYRMALKNCTGSARETLLDRIRAVKDHEIDDAISEIPVAYMTSGQAEATGAFLKARRDVLDTVLVSYW